MTAFGEREQARQLCARLAAAVTDVIDLRLDLWVRVMGERELARVADILADWPPDNLELVQATIATGDLVCQELQGLIEGARREIRRRQREAMKEGSRP